jgi:zinc transporter ZupT
LPPEFTSILLVSSAFSMVGAAAGVWLATVPEITRRMVPVCGAILLLLSLFWVLPELAETLGWGAGPALLFTGFGLLWIIDRYIHPVCPACSHNHDHDSCSTRLHGFATPLLAAALIHSLFDGWTLAAGSELVHSGSALVLSVVIHKIPESLAFGVILRAALRSRSTALTWAVGVQAAMIPGALLAVVLAPVIGSRWMSVLLALGGGTFLYLGFHAVHGEWRRRVASRASA